MASAQRLAGYRFERRLHGRRKAHELLRRLRSEAFSVTLDLPYFVEFFPC
jgi:hypothetical protein